MGERAFGQGLRSGLNTFISAGGISETKDFLARRYGVDSKTGKLNKLGKAFAEKVTEQGMADNPFLATEGLEELTDEQLLDFLPANPDYNPLPTPIRPDTPIGMDNLSMDNILMEGDLNFTDLSEITDTPLTDFSYDDLVQYGTFQGPTMDFMPAMRGGGMVNMMPKYEYGGFVKEREKERFDAMNTPTSFGSQPNSIGENSGFTSRATSVGGNIGMPIQNNYGYGTATSAAGALRQMGMEDVLNDPRFAEFADDLPQFSMGYQQQIGDIQTGGQQAAQQLRTRQRQLGSGFTGFGAGQTQLQQNFRNLGTDMQRQQRGVIEGFQADLLSAVGDIEAKGQFEFGSGPTSTTNPNEALDMIEEAKDMINSGSQFDRLRGEAALKELENQGYNIA